MFSSVLQLQYYTGISYNILDYAKLIETLQTLQSFILSPDPSITKNISHISESEDLALIL